MFALLKLNKPIHWLLTIVLSQWLISTASAYSFGHLDSIKVHGFASQGYFLSSENNIYGESSKHRGALGLTETGINVSYKPLHNLRLAAQGIYRHAGNVNEDAQLDYALLDWTFLSHNDLRIGVRLGRVKTPFGLYNETRDVAFTRPSITLPSIYFERSRDLLLSSDGLQFYADKGTPIGNLSFQLNAGQLGEELDELQDAVLGQGALGKLENELGYLAKLAYESTSGATRLAFSFDNFDMKYEPGSGDFLDDGNINFQQFLLSAQQHIGPVTFTGEYLRQENIFENFGPFYPKTAPVSESYYIQADYRFNQQFKGYSRYDVLYLNKDDKQPDVLPSGVSPHMTFNKSYMVGLQWTPASQWMLQAEYHRHNGASSLSFADNPNPAAIKQHWSVFALQVSYRF